MILKYFDKQILSFSISIVIQYFFKHNYNLKQLLIGKLVESVRIWFVPGEPDFVTCSLSLLSHCCR